jgi:hypothetical protein
MSENVAIRMRMLNMILAPFVHLVCLHDNTSANIKLVPMPIEGPNTRNIVTKQAIGRNVTC